MSRDAMVYVLARRDTRLVGARTLDSSFDTYDQQFGWTDEDYDRARGGTEVTSYTVGISAITQSRRDIDIATRLKDSTLEKEGMTAGQVLLRRIQDHLFDVGVYGVFNTLTGELLQDSPGFRGDEKSVFRNG